MPGSGYYIMSHAQPPVVTRSILLELKPPFSQLIMGVNSQGSGETVHMHNLNRTMAVQYMIMALLSDANPI